MYSGLLSENLATSMTAEGDGSGRREGELARLPRGPAQRRRPVSPGPPRCHVRR
jgi:hypothetical protein